MLILAGVSIATLTGENGILTRAQEAKTKTEEAEEDELRKLTQAEAATHLENYEYIDNSTGEERIITIPAGFAVSQVEEENTIKDGLVIIDSEGNEFVWIPVDEINDIAQCSTAGGNCNLILQNDEIVCETHNYNTNIVGKLFATTLGNNFGTENITYNANSGLRESAIITGNNLGTGSDYDGNATTYLNIINEILGTTYSSASEFLIDMREDYKEMAKSVAKYHGFYIGRYEISKSDSNTAQSKANSIVLTADNDNTIEEMNGNTWYGLYAYGKTYNNSANSVKSSMVWGSQYDAMMRWIQSGENGINVTEANDEIKNINPTYTGPAGDTDVMKNVFDLYGGRREWTLEANNADCRVNRGGNYSSSGSPSDRYSVYPTDTNSARSSRLALYMK